MKLTQNLKRILSAALVLVLIFSMVPVTAQAAPVRKPGKTPASVTKPSTGSTTVAPTTDADYLFLASSRNGDDTKLPALVSGTEAVIGENQLDYVGLTGDIVASNVPYNSSSILSEITGSATNLSSRNVDIIAGANDASVIDDAGIVLPYQKGGSLVYEGSRFYVYGVEESCISSSSDDAFWAAEAQKFVDWANHPDTDPSKAIIVLSHLPLVKKINNGGAYEWHKALNTVATGISETSIPTDTSIIRDILFIQGYNHIDENESFVNANRSITVANGSSSVSVVLFYNYVTAGYMHNGHSTLVTITDAAITVDMYAATGPYMKNIVPITRHQHTWVETNVVEATCTAEGSVTSACACGATKTTVIPVTDHSYETVITEATCTSEGSIVYTCTVCNHSFTDVIPALGHKLKETITPATCSKDGSKISVCLNCGERTVEVLTASGHNYIVTNIVNATCTTGGYTTYTCTNCSRSYHGNIISALGHSYKTIVTAPTCIAIGFTTNTCSRCGDYTVSDSIPAMGHNYVGVKNAQEGYITYTCEHCLDSYQEAFVPGFTYETVKSFTTNGSFVITTYHNGIHYALSHKNHTITPVPVNVVDGRIVSDVTDDMLWKYSNKRLYYKDDGTVYYLTDATSAPGIGTSNPANIALSSNRLKVGSNYLRYSGSSFVLNASASSTYLFKQVQQ